MMHEGEKDDEIRVLGLVSYNFLPAKMGGQKCVNVLYAFLCKRVNLVCVTTKNNDPSQANYEVLNILSNSALRYANFFYFFKLRKIILKRGITHLQIEHPYYGWLALMLKTFCKVKLVLHSHNIEGLRFKSIGKWWWRLLLLYEKKVHQKADYIFYITDFDRQYAVNKFGIDPSKGLIVPYGVDKTAPPSIDKKKKCRDVLVQRHNITEDATILFLNGDFSYKPNAEALYFVIRYLNPFMLKNAGFVYKIVICGKNIPPNILTEKLENVDIAGFVDNIDIYFAGADIFLNPISGGGGIKTKLVEALASGLSAVSFEDGAIGIPLNVTGNKLVLVPEDKKNAEMFYDAILFLKSHQLGVSPAFFEYFNAKIIADKAANFISGD